MDVNPDSEQQDQIMTDENESKFDNYISTLQHHILHDKSLQEDNQDNDVGLYVKKDLLQILADDEKSERLKYFKNQIKEATSDIHLMNQLIVQYKKFQGIKQSIQQIQTGF